jgi:hypothetical protein
MDEDLKPEPPKVEWEYKTQFSINERMREVIQATIKVAQADIESYRKKLRKLTYGA